MIAARQILFAALIVAGWILRTLQVGRPWSKILPAWLIPIEIVRSCGGGSAPSEDLKLLSIVTETGATPVRVNARGEVVPSEATITFPPCSTSARATPAAHRASRNAT